MTDMTPEYAPSADALELAETLVNHQFGVSVYRLACALDDFRRQGIELALRDMPEPPLRGLPQEAE
jgi:hypothetical protein